MLVQERCAPRLQSSVMLQQIRSFSPWWRTLIALFLPSISCSFCMSPHLFTRPLLHIYPAISVHSDISYFFCLINHVCFCSRLFETEYDLAARFFKYVANQYNNMLRQLMASYAKGSQINQYVKRRVSERWKQEMYTILLNIAQP
jgi:hypothetical protein